VKMFAAPATPPLNAFTLPSEKPGPILASSTHRSRQSGDPGWCAHSDQFLEVIANGVSLVLDLLCASFAGGHSSVCGKSACDRTYSLATGEGCKDRW